MKGGGELQSPLETNMVQKKKVLAMAVAAAVLGLGYAPFGAAEASAQTTEYHSPSPLRAQREAAEKHYKEMQANQKTEQSDASVGKLPVIGQYSSISKHGLEHKSKLAVKGSDGKTYNILASYNESNELAEAYNKTFVYDTAPVENNGMHFGRKLHATVHVEDSIADDGTEGKFVSVTRDYVRRWSESSVSKVPILGTTTEQYFFPGEQGKDFDLSEITSLKPSAYLSEKDVAEITGSDLDAAQTSEKGRGNAKS